MLTRIDKLIFPVCFYDATRKICWLEKNFVKFIVDYYFDNIQNFILPDPTFFEESILLKILPPFLSPKKCQAQALPRLSGRRVHSKN